VHGGSAFFKCPGENDDAPGEIGSPGNNLNVWPGRNTAPFGLPVRMKVRKLVCVNVPRAIVSSFLGVVDHS
jgi:hypothetical protein